MSTYDTAQFLWVEGRLSTLERLCLAFFLDHGYKVHLYCYKPLSNVPDGVEVRSGEEILPAQDVFLAEGVNESSYASFADRFRLHLLAKKGGWWFDMDMVCLKNMPPPAMITFASTWEGEFGECANNCALWCQPNDPVMLRIRDACDTAVSCGDIAFGSLGPFLVQRYVRDLSLHDHVAPWYEFCPYPWRLVHRLASRTATDYLKDAGRNLKHRAWQIVDPKFKAGYPRAMSRTIHLHNEIWKASGLSKDASYFPLSVIEQLKRKYLRT